MISALGAAQGMNCNMQGYKAVDGLKAVAGASGVTLNWTGEAQQQLRAEFVLRDGQPVVAELAASKAGGAWVVLGKNLMPQFEVTTGRRRISTTELDILKRLGKDTPENEDWYKWMVFWDAPLVVPGHERLVGPGRTQDEIKRAAASYKSDQCTVKTDGDRVSVTFNGLTLGIFSGDLQFTVYKGSNLLRQEAMASTNAKDVAFIYKAGLKGFPIANGNKVVWRDTSQMWQEQNFGGAVNQQPVNIRARNRLEILQTGAGSLAVFPPPHKFFFARENEVNGGYVYTRKDNDSSFSLGVMQPERCEGYDPWGVSPEVWNHRASTARSQAENCALYNAPPGTVQRMAAFYYLSATGSHATQQAVMAYTHDDVYKPVPGFKTVTGHFHLELNEMVRDQGTSDFQPTWVPVFRGLGINIVYLGDFHDDSDGTDPGPKRLPEQKDYFEASAKLSDKDFLVMPAEEANAFIAGHTYIMTPGPIYYTHPRQLAAGTQFKENVPGYGTVYNLGSAADVLRFLNETKSIIWVAHPRTKSWRCIPTCIRTRTTSRATVLSADRGSRCRLTFHSRGCARCAASA